MIGFTQSSCPAFHLLPSDEDYKTLPFEQKKPDKVIGFTQSSCPAFHLLPSDEDYKTLPFVISLQRWDKGLEYASFELDFMKYPYIILSGLPALWF